MACVYNLCLLGLTVSLTLGMVIGSSVLKFKHRDCADVKRSGNTQNGTYTVWFNESTPTQVFCEFTRENAFTVIQRQVYGLVSFYRGWYDYVVGFGHHGGDFWLGLNNIHSLTSQGNTVLTVNMMDWNGNHRQARYGVFSVGTATTRYHLQIGHFSGNVPDDLSYNNGMMFYTYDYPDHNGCAIHQKAGWWYNYCTFALPNGRYYPKGHYTPSAFGDGIYWQHWLGVNYSLKFISMTLSPL